MHESLVQIILTALHEGEVFTGADREYAFRFEAEENNYFIWERDDRGGTAEQNPVKEEMLQWLRHFPLFYLLSQLEHYLIARGMENLDKKDHARAFIFFTMATEHGMSLGNLGLALLYLRKKDKKKSADALGQVPLAAGTPYSEIPIRSFLIHVGRWDDNKQRVKILKEFLKIAPGHTDARELLTPPHSPE